MSLLFAFPQEEKLAHQLDVAVGAWEWRHFPDGESYVRVLSDVKGQSVTILCSLNQPDEKILPLLFLTRTLRDLGAVKVTLVAPYLGYMRQDARFHPGEAITADIFARLLSPLIDKLITVDPHLHRHPRLEDIYQCECQRLSASPLMIAWIRQHVESPLIIGPDMESRQWVENVASAVEAPFIILEKNRKSDHDVEMTLPDIEAHQGRTPVIIDDIISTAGTMTKTVSWLRQRGHGTVVCLATHGLFAGEAYAMLTRAGGTVISANTIPHPSNVLDIAPLVVPFLR